MKKLIAALLAATLTVSSTAVAFAGTAPKRGDVNLDGKVDVTDATLVQMSAAELIELTADQQKAADVTGDNKIDVTDATLIQMYAAELIDKF